MSGEDNNKKLDDQNKGVGDQGTKENASGSQKSGEDQSVKDMMREMSDTMKSMKETMDGQTSIIQEQAEKIKELEKSTDPKNVKRKKRERNRTIKDEERLVNMYLIDIDINSQNQFAYFEEDRRNLEDKKMFRKELLIRKIKRTYNEMKSDKKQYLYGVFECVDKEKKTYEINIPFAAINEIKRTIKAQTVKVYKKSDEKDEGQTTKYIRDDDGMVIDEYDIDLVSTKTHYWFDLVIVTECNFKEMKFEKVPESEVNIF